MTIKNVPALQVLGKLTFEPTDPPRPLDTYVVQRVKPGLGNVASDPTGSLQVRAYTIGTDARSPAQLAMRDRVRAANAAWKALDPAGREAWRQRGAGRAISGYNAFVSAFLKAPPTAP